MGSEFKQVSGLRGCMKPRLKTIFLLPCLAALSVALSGPLTAQEFDGVHKCDEFAAHPDDPNRWSDGVADEDIIPGPAVKYCQDAVAEYPDTPRFAFQLGRALWAANRLDEGVQVFLKLEEDFEYGPVYAYLGDAYLYGLGGVETDEEMAVALYQIAAEQGFAPAEEVLAALADGNTGEDEQIAATEPEVPAAPAPASPVTTTSGHQPAHSEQEQPFDPRQFNQPRLIGALFSGNFADMKSVGVGKTNYAGLSNAYVYVQSLHKEFSATVNFIDQTCVQLYKPLVQKRLDSTLLNIMTGGQRSLEGSLNAGAERGFEMLEEILTDMNQGGIGKWLETQQDLQVLASSGSNDAGRLISAYGCESETVRRIYANIEAYAFGRPGILSPEEEERQAVEREKEAKRQEEARQLAMRDDARSSCMGQFSHTEKCGCMISALDGGGLSDAEWDTLKTDFKQVTKISNGHGDLKEQVRACLR